VKDHRERGYFLRSIEPIARGVIDERPCNVIQLTIQLIRLIGPGLELRTGSGRTDNGKMHQRLTELLDEYFPLKIVEVDGGATDLIVPTDEIAIAPQRVIGE